MGCGLGWGSRLPWTGPCLAHMKLPSWNGVQWGVCGPAAVGWAQPSLPAPPTCALGPAAPGWAGLCGWRGSEATSLLCCGWCGGQWGAELLTRLTPPCALLASEPVFRGLCERRGREDQVSAQPGGTPAPALLQPGPPGILTDVRTQPPTPKHRGVSPKCKSLHFWASQTKENKGKLQMPCRWACVAALSRSSKPAASVWPVLCPLPTGPLACSVLPGRLRWRL